MNLDALEQEHGKITLWEWVRAWLENKDNERLYNLEDYLDFRSQN